MSSENGGSRSPIRSSRTGEKMLSFATVEDASGTDCTKCGAKRTVVEHGDSGMVVCSVCGFVVGESGIQSEQGFVLGSSFLRPLEAFHGTRSLVSGQFGIVDQQLLMKDRSRLAGLRRLDEILNLLPLLNDASCKKQIIFLLDEHMAPSRGIWHSGKKLDRQISATCLLVARRRSLPVTLSEICRAVDCDQAKVVRSFFSLRNESGLGAVDHGCSLLLGRVLSHLPGNLPVGEIRTTAQHLLRLCQEEWICEGRKPAPVVFAVVKVACCICHCEKRVSFKVLEELSQLGRISYGDRVVELRNALFELGKCLPWGSTLDERSFLSVSGKQIVENMNFLSIVRNHKKDAGLIEGLPIPKEEVKGAKSVRAALVPPDASGSGQEVHIVPDDVFSYVSGASAAEVRARRRSGRRESTSKERAAVEPPEGWNEVRDREEVGEWDIPEEEISTYVRTEREVRELSSLSPRENIRLSIRKRARRTHTRTADPK